MKLIHDGTAPLASSALVADLLSALTGQPLVLALFSAIFTALVRSSAAVIGLALSLASAGLMPLVGAIPVILGANIGTAATAVLAAVGQNAEARRGGPGPPGLQGNRRGGFFSLLLPLPGPLRAAPPRPPRASP